jgi:hypothetical protein
MLKIVLPLAVGVRVPTKIALNHDQDQSTNKSLSHSDPHGQGCCSPMSERGRLWLKVKIRENHLDQQVSGSVEHWGLIWRRICPWKR